jgi:hypothetical protein
MKGELVDVESPYGNKDKSIVARNIRFARACLRDCLLREEIPFASHLLYTQSGILDDEKEDERILGINAGKALLKNADRTVVYENYGISTGMKYGIENAEKSGRPVEYRKLPEDWEEQQNEIVRHHSDSRLWRIIL